MNKYFGSSILDITKNSEVLFQNFDSKWRNLLRKGKKNYSDNYTILSTKEEVNLFITHYLLFAKANNFKTKNEKYYSNLLLNNSHFHIFTNKYSNNSDKFDGAIVIFINGQTSTYFLGINNEISRKKCLNYYLIWEAILFSKNLGCNYFDLGGLTKNTPHGIQHFKKGINGIVYTNINDRFKIKLI